jgi:broad specificity phosphatase PhoE
MARQLLLVRHAEASGGRPGVLIGRSDPSLSKAGRRHALGLRPLLPNGPGVAFFSSPLARTRQTATIATGPHVAIQIDDNLREIDFGDWEGRAIADLQASRPAEMAHWAGAPFEFTFPGGESLASFWRRVTAAGERLAGRAEDSTVAFTHGGVIRALICHFLGLELERYVLFDVAPASVTLIRVHGDRGTLAGMWQAIEPPEASSARRG